MSLIDTPNGVTMQWLMDDKFDERAGVSLAKMTVAIGLTSEKHHHTNCTETIHVLDGQIEQSIGSKHKYYLPVRHVSSREARRTKPAMLAINLPL